MFIVFRQMVNYDQQPVGKVEILFVTLDKAIAQVYAEGSNKNEYRNDGNHYHYTYQEVEVK